MPIPSFLSRRPIFRLGPWTMALKIPTSGSHGVACAGPLLRTSTWARRAGSGGDHADRYSEFKYRHCVNSRAAGDSLGLLRCHIGRDIEEIGIRQLADDLLHLAQRRPLAITGPHIGQLPDQVIGAAPGDPRGIFMAAIVVAMAGPARPHLAAIAHRHAAVLRPPTHRHIIDKADMVVAPPDLLILGDF